VDAFGTYANYTIFVLEDQLDAVDTIWFLAFAKYDERFHEQIVAHEKFEITDKQAQASVPVEGKDCAIGAGADRSNLQWLPRSL
jgi:hypothetical protein